MMNNLKDAIINNTLPQYNDPNQDIYVYILAEVITYRNLTKILKADSGKLSYVFNITSSLFSTVLSDMENHKASYASYSDMKNYLVLNRFNNIESLFNMNESDVDAISKLYSDKTLIQAFSRLSFNASSYSITSLTKAQYNRCVKLHENVMIPIIEYYIQEYNVKDSDMKILNATEVNYNPMKVITFSINGITAQRIFTDINRKRIQISDYIYSVTFAGNYVTITTL